jgi:RNase adapter protein RapZ
MNPLPEMQPGIDIVRPDVSRTPEIVVITGMSGAGKTSALRVFEDANFFTIDNLPPQLLDKFIALCLAGSQTNPTFTGMAVVIDIRAREFFVGLVESVAALKQAGYDVKIIFMDAKDHILVRRYKETRREHPLAMPGESLEKALSRERALLADVEREADFTLDTSNVKPADLRKQITSYITNERQNPSTTIRILSFGYKYGIPLDPDFVFDVRFLPNPFYVPELRGMTGLEGEVACYIEKAPETAEFLDMVEKFLKWVLPKLSEEGRLRLNVAIGCTGGQHRSVYIAEKLGEALKKDGYEINVVHRDIGK